MPLPFQPEQVEVGREPSAVQLQAEGRAQASKGRLEPRKDLTPQPPVGSSGREIGDRILLVFNLRLRAINFLILKEHARDDHG